MAKINWVRVNFEGGIPINTINIPEHLLVKLERPGQYLGGEYNAVHKDIQSVRASLLFAFPDTYEIGMSHLGMRLIYEAVNGHDDLLCERSFMPLDDMTGLLRQHNLPLFSWESRRPLADFDLVGFTLQYELSFTNILHMMDLAKIPLLAADRLAWPVIIAGGPCVYNPEPLADFIDLFVLGDGEEITVTLLNLVAEIKQRGGSKQEFLHEAAKLNGCYVPGYYTAEYTDDGDFVALRPINDAPNKIQRIVLADLDQAVWPDKPLVAQPKAVHDRTMLEIMRGCDRGCRFCQAGIIYRPVREKNVNTLVDQARKSIENSGYEDIALLSLSSADYSQIEPLMDALLAEHEPKGVGISLPSLRVDAFSVDLAAKTARVRKSGLTLAPEAGSQRLRDIINKGVIEEDLWAAVEAAFTQGYSSIKLYFMIGLPFETYEDIAAIADMCRKVLAIGRRCRPAGMHKPLKINLGVSSFVPKAHTPFQYCAQNTAEELKAKQDFLRQQIKNMKQVSLNYHDVRVSKLEAAFARGDRRLGKVLLNAYRAGCHLDGWTEHFRQDLWLQAFAATGLTMEQFAEKQYAPEDVLPWQHLDTGISAAWLANEYQKAAQGALTADCRQGGCSGCGVCPGLERQNMLARVETISVQQNESDLNGEPVARYRCRLAISGVYTWTSHLEILSAMEKALRRSGAPLAFSQGFNPHMLLSWGPAHPVGVYGDNEWFDVYFRKQPDDDWVGKLNDVLPQGLHIMDVKPIEFSVKSLMASLNYAEYCFDIPGEVDFDYVNNKISELMKLNSYSVMRHSPKGNKTVDIRPSLQKLQIMDDKICFAVRLDFGAAAKPQEVASAICDEWQIGAAERMDIKQV